jgi:hypothetical protein
MDAEGCLDRLGERAVLDAAVKFPAVNLAEIDL